MFSSMRSSSPQILFIDNYDSFTYNLIQAFSTLKASIQIFQNDQIPLDRLYALQPTHLVLGPGPRCPSEAGDLLSVLQYFYDKLPILGVCLGHQAIGEFFGARIDKANQVLHGKKDWLHHRQSNILTGLPSPLQVGRYHSLAIQSLPDCLQLEARAEDDTIMAISHRHYPIFGIQFHPESILTPQGYFILRNFLNIS